jgi:Ca2+-binding RTX toxin-like protein
MVLTGSMAINATGNTLNNILTGNTGNNILNGGLGNDILTGNQGLDTFQLSTSGNIDKLTDFSPVDDTIQLENAVFTSLINTGIVSANSFRSGAGLTTAADANDFLIYNSSTGGLWYDAGGNMTGSGSAVQIAILGANLVLTNADFAVI